MDVAVWTAIGCDVI